MGNDNRMKKIISLFTVLLFHAFNRKAEIIVSSNCLIIGCRVLTKLKGGG